MLFVGEVALAAVNVRMAEMMDWATANPKKDTNLVILNHLLKKVTI